MKRVSLVTYHCSPNAGAVMQTYALCRYLKEQGYEVEVVDIRNFEPNLKTISEGSPLFIRLAKSVIYPLRIHKIFKKYYPSVSKHYLSIDELRENPPESDYYIVGSDQVWNHSIGRDKALAYFLDFGSPEVKRLSYASSFGLDHWEEGPYASTEQVQRCFDRFCAVSVREIEGARILKETFGKDASVVLDPTLLNDRYPEISGVVVQRKEIVCYKLNKTRDFWRFMPTVANMIGFPALLLNHNYPKRGYKYHFNPTVNQWVNRIAGAAFVLTDSFHGAAFSIIYRKPFAAILNHNGKDSRLISLLKQLHLEDRMFNSLEDMTKNDNWLTPIDYKKVEPYLKTLKEQSENYLLDALNYNRI